MGDGKILIMGVGGCGSSFLWGLLGACGLETLGINEWMRHSGIRRAIEEGRAYEFKFPKVIKHLGGFICNLNDHIDRHDWEIEHIFFAVSSFELQMKAYRKRRPNKDTTEWDPEEWEVKYRDALGKGMLQLIERDHPFTMVRCPRSIKDPQYCYNQVRVVLPNMTYEEFEEIHSSRILPGFYKKIENFE